VPEVADVCRVPVIPVAGRRLREHVSGALVTPVLHPECQKPPASRLDAHSPESVALDWGQPIRLGRPINTACPEDAIEISGDGQHLYFLFTIGILGELTRGDHRPPNGTYRAARTGGPAEFDTPVFFDLGKGQTPRSMGS